MLTSGTSLRIQEQGGWPGQSLASAWVIVVGRLAWKQVNAPHEIPCLLGRSSMMPKLCVVASRPLREARNGCPKVMSCAT